MTLKPQAVQFGSQPPVNPVVQFGSQPVTEETVTSSPGDDAPHRAEDAGEDAGTGTVPAYAGGSAVPKSKRGK